MLLNASSMSAINRSEDDPVQLNLCIHQPASSWAWKPVILPLLLSSIMVDGSQKWNCEYLPLCGRFVSLNPVLGFTDVTTYGNISSCDQPEWNSIMYVPHCLFVSLLWSTEILCRGSCKRCAVGSVDSSWRFQFFSKVLKCKIAWSLVNSVFILKDVHHALPSESTVLRYFQWHTKAQSL